MVTLPKNRKNTAERLNKGVEDCLEYICKQIEKNYEKDPNKDVVAVVNDKVDGYKTDHVILFDNDIILNAIREVKRQGYFVWTHNDYMGYNSYWITQTPNQPHSWYRPI